MAQVLEKVYDVVMPNARSHGNSTAPTHGYHYSNLAADAISFIDQLELANPVLLGHSMEGMTTAVVASRNPKYLRGLVLADPTFLTPQRQREVYNSDVVDQHWQILNRPREEYLAEIRARHSRRSQEIIELFAQARLQTSIHAFEILKPPNPAYMQLIKTIDVPTLLVIGNVGSIVCSEVAAKLVGLNQHLKILQIAKAGHGVPYDQPKRFSAAVKNFLLSLNAL